MDKLFLCVGCVLFIQALVELRFDQSLDFLGEAPPFEIPCSSVCLKKKTL